MEIKLPKLSVKNLFVVLGLVLVVLFGMDYYATRKENKLISQYLRQTLKMTDGKEPTRAQLFDVLLMERFKPADPPKEEKPVEEDKNKK